MDGKMIDGNIKLSGINEEFIFNCLNKSNIKSVKDVILMTLDNNGEVFIQERNKEEYKCFTVDFAGGDRW